MKELEVLNSVLDTNKFLLNKNKDDLKTHGLSLAEYFALEIIYEKKEIAVQALANKLNLFPGSARHTIDGLLKKKYISSKKTLFDKRLYILFLSEKGRKFFEEISISHEKYMSNVISDSLSLEEQENLIELLSKITK